MKPIVVINFKTYKQGEDVVRLAKAIEKNDSSMIICVSATDVYEVNKKTKLQVYSQHIDFQEKGRATGFILPESVKADGAKGTLLNHSEHPIKFGILKKSVKRAREVGLKIIICVPNLKIAKKVLKLKPEGIAFEVPELIATGKSISKEKPESVRKFSEIVDRYNQRKKLNIKKLCGAGISNSEDVYSSLELGCDGVLIASAITKARNPGKVVKSIRKRKRKSKRTN